MLKYRSAEKEQMDDLNLSGDQLHLTLDGLSVINKYLGNTNATFKAVKQEIQRSKESLTIIDLGCGGGDNLRKIAQWCHQNNKKAHLIGVDGNAHTLEYARIKNVNGIHVDYEQADILLPSFELPSCDILISSHFMYHFSDDELIAFLRKAKAKISSKIIFSELDRSSVAYVLFKIGGVFLPFSRMVKQDGLKAIRRSFKQVELESVFTKAGFLKVKIKWKWAFRHLIEVNL